MTVVLCDICRRELQPRTTYTWVSKGGLVALHDGQPIRLEFGGRQVDDCCTACAERCVARVFVRTKG